MLADDYLVELSVVLARTPLTMDDISDASDLIKTIEACPMTKDQKSQLNAFKQLVDKEKLETLFGCPKEHAGRSVQWQQSKNRLSLLMNSRQQLLESEGVAQNTIDELARQEEIISSATKKTQQTNGNLSWASKLATKMNSIWR